MCATASVPGFTRTEFQGARRLGRAGPRARVSRGLDPLDVARASLDGAAAGRAHVVPGAGYKALVGTTQVIPGGPKRWLAATVRRLAR